MKERHHRNILSVASFDICRYCSCCLTFLYGSYRVDLSKEKRKYRMAKSKKIVMTGGGTAGHVTPNIALMPALQEAGYEITYIGSYNGMEKELIEAQKIPYIGISSGKLRRYFDWKNFSDPFKVLKGYGRQSPSCANSNRTLSFPKVDLCLFRLSLPQSTAIFRQLSTNPISHRDLQTKLQSAVQKSML